MQNAIVNNNQLDRASQVEFVKNIILRENNNSTITGVSLGVVGRREKPIINHGFASNRRLKISQKMYWRLRNKPNKMQARRNGRLIAFILKGFGAI